MELKELPCTPDLPTADPLSNGITSCSIYCGLGGRRRLAKVGGGAFGYLVGPPDGFMIYSFTLLAFFGPDTSRSTNTNLVIRQLGVFEFS